VFIKRLQDCKEIVAGDACRLRELLNAKQECASFRYSLAHAVVKPGQKTAPHAMKTSEVYYILQGRGRMHVYRESEDVEAGCVVEIPPHAVQWIENTGPGDLAFLCIVDPAWCPEDEVIL